MLNKIIRGSEMKILILVLFLTGCATQKPIAAFDLEGLIELNANTLCRDYFKLEEGNNLLPKAKLQLESVMIEKGVSKEDIANIHKKSLRVGMSECSALAILGDPNIENVTQSQRGKRGQYVYHSTPYSTGSLHLYINNGVVTGWQL
jgi:hypothetical protein